MDKKDYMDPEVWEATLEAEGLGVLDIEREQMSTSSVLVKRGRKHAWLEGEMIGQHYKPGDPRYMSPSPLTAMATETRLMFDDAGDLSFVAGSKLLSELEINREDVKDLIEQSGSLEDLMVDQCGEDDYESGESWMDQLAVSLVASRKEAELADRAKQTLRGLSDRGVVLKGTERLKTTAKQRNANRRALQEGRPLPYETNPFVDQAKVAPTDVVQRAPLRCDYFKKEQGLPCAHSDGGNGPLAIKDTPAPEPLADRVGGSTVRMSPLVPTMYYYPGRSPYEMGLFASQNSDITG